MGDYYDQGELAESHMGIDNQQHNLPNECPTCNFPMVWVSAAPGPSEYVCKVCDLRAEIDLIQESRKEFHDLLITAFEKLVYMGYPIDQFPGMTPDLLTKAWKQIRDHESYT